jgi:hypothetical protein
LAGNAALAASITIDGEKLTTIYSQASFGTTPIAIVVLPSATVSGPTNLTTDALVDQLFALGPPLPLSSMLFLSIASAPATVLVTELLAVPTAPATIWSFSLPTQQPT